MKNFISRNLNNCKGLRTSRKIVIIESDDWGSIRMPNKETYNRLLKKNINLERCPYSRFDSLASHMDLEALFDVLLNYKDYKGKNPVVTANAVMANPDFEKIRNTGFNSYHYEIFPETLEKYSSHQNSFKLWKKGLVDGIFFPQFHGREHVNVKLWLSLLKDKSSLYSAIFDYNLWGMVEPITGSSKMNMQASFDALELNEIDEHIKILDEGLNIYRSIFNVESKSFIAPNFIYHTDLNQTLYDNGVRYIQGMKYQILPLLNKPKREMIRHYTGELNKFGQYYLVRNCVFEPSLYPENHDNVGECLKGIRNAFFWRKPAIITSHRLNFIGYIHPENRERNLKQFRELLGTILKKWPDVEFMTSVELGDLISASDHPN